MGSRCTMSLEYKGRMVDVETYHKLKAADGIEEVKNTKKTIQDFSKGVSAMDEAKTKKMEELSKKEPAKVSNVSASEILKETQAGEEIVTTESNETISITELELKEEVKEDSKEDSKEEVKEDSKEELLKKAKELGINAMANWKEETIQKKIDSKLAE